MADPVRVMIQMRATPALAAAAFTTGAAAPPDGAQELHRRGMDGTGVRVAIVDTGFNLTYLRSKGKTPAFDAELSWGPNGGQPLGEMPVDHGTMCAFDVCIAAPNCTLVDHAVLTSQS